MLSQQISRRGFTYNIMDPFAKEYVALKHISYKQELDDENLYDKLKENIQSDAFMNKPYKGVNMIYVTRKSVIVPNAIFDKQSLKEIAQANFDILPTEEIQFNKLKSISAYNVFVVPSYITTLMVNQFPEINFYHQATPFIENLILNTSDELKVSINLYYDFIDIAVTEKGKLLFYNTFGYQTSTDLLYLVANVCGKLKLEKDVPIVLSGYIERESNNFKLLFKYFSNVSCAEIPGEYDFPFNDVPDFTFNNMLTLPLCV